MRRLFSRLLATLAVATTTARAITPQEAEFFEKQVRPVLADHCYKCHGPEKQKAELRVDSREFLLKGSENGAVVVPGKPGEGEFLKSIRHEGETKMPEKKPKLPDAQIAALTEWVRMGLPWPETDQAKLSGQQQAAKTHWSFQPVRKPPVPEKPAASNPIDAFILAKLEPAGLKLSPPADARTFIRRATLDLTGLPPTIEEVEAFAADSIRDPQPSGARQTAEGGPQGEGGAPSQSAIRNLIDRLLASPRYGERWGRYWLDVARYADTKGYVFQEERRYAYSYTYRDWVIRALNEDLPYDQFLIHQIAADRIVKKDDPSPLAAMGFLTLGRRFLNAQPDIIDDRIDLITRGTMGLTVTCARCHDHKFDPISQKDYYALYGVFASSIEPKDLPALPGHRDPKTEAEYQKKLAEKQGAVDAELKHHGELLGLRISLTTGVPAAVPFQFADRALDQAGKDGIRDLRNKVDVLNAGPLSPPHAMAMQDAPQPVDPHVFIRGNAGRPGEKVPRRFLTVLSGGDPQPFKQGSGRLELAQAIASKDNPLTARVIVNRVWNLHFGAGLVRTPGDFGVKGEPPTHPELLDFLASRFVEEGWSLKKLHRAIMLSATYQQASEPRADATQMDPENRLLSRQNRRRLDFEATRDSLLYVTGQLDAAMGGIGVDITTQPFARRRTVYGFIDRQNLPGVFRTFDFASPDTTSPQRYQTTVPQQALFMLNSPFVIEQARALVAKTKPQPVPGESDVQAFFAQVFARRAEPAEVESGLRYLRAQLAAAANADPKPAWQYGSGRYDAAARKVEFSPLPHWTGTAWQGGPKRPDAKLGWVMLHAHGGHPAKDRAAIRRWTAPRDGVISIAGQLAHSEKHGDGVQGRIISSRAGELLQVVAELGATVEAKVARVEVKAGETLDFLVECRASETSDSFSWTPVIHGDLGDFDANIAFAGPPPVRATPLTGWEKYAQALLAANEFVFVD